MDLTIKLYIAVERSGKIFVFNEEPHEYKEFTYNGSEINDYGSYPIWCVRKTTYVNGPFHENTTDNIDYGVQIPRQMIKDFLGYIPEYTGEPIRINF